MQGFNFMTKNTKSFIISTIIWSLVIYFSNITFNVYEKHIAKSHAEKVIRDYDLKMQKIKDDERRKTKLELDRLQNEYKCSLGF